MAREVGDWGLPPAVACLQRLSHRAHGVRDSAFLAELRPLLETRAVKQKLSAGVTPRRALELAFDQLLNFAGRSGSLSAEEYYAAVALLFLRSSVPVGRDRSDTLLTQSHPQRADVAARILGHQNGVALIRNRAPRRQLPKRSHETDLFSKVLDALDALDVPPSATRALRRTPPQDGAGAVGALEDLVGTWRGTIRSDWILKREGVERAGVVDCYMTIQFESGQPRIRWLKEHGHAEAIAAHVVRLGADARRLVACYEADVYPVPDQQGPSHRGSCLLDIIGDRAYRIEGPYWTDRTTDGLLAFHHRVDAILETFEAAQAHLATRTGPPTGGPTEPGVTPPTPSRGIRA